MCKIGKTEGGVGGQGSRVDLRYANFEMTIRFHVKMSSEQLGVQVWSSGAQSVLETHIWEALPRGWRLMP